MLGLGALLIAMLGAEPDAGVERPSTSPSTSTSTVFTGQLTGRVQTMGTREGIPVAYVTVGTDSVETDDDGRFTLELDAGTYHVKISAAAHKPREFVESISAGQRLEVVYRLDRNAIAPYETVVRDQRSRTEVARVQLAPAETHESAGTMGEPLRAVMQLPGVSAVVSGLAYPVVRGTQPAATAYYLDGIRIPQLFHALAGPSVLNPDFIDRIDFFPGVPPARFGRLLGGAIEATAAKPAEKLTLAGSIDLINASAFALLPIRKTGTSITAAARVSYTPLIGARIAQEVIPKNPTDPPTQIIANFYDYQARIEQKVGAGRLRLLAFGAGDEVGTKPNGGNIPTGVLRSYFHRVDLLVTYPFGPGTFEAGLTFGRDIAGVVGEQTAKREFSLVMGRTLGSVRLAYSVEPLPGLTLRAGADAEVQATTTDVSGVSESLMQEAGRSETHTTADGTLAGAYVQLRYVDGPFETTAGVRADAYQKRPNVSWATVEPRLEQRVRLNERVSVRAAAGLFHQPPTLSLSFPISDIGLLDEGLQYAGHSEVGADVKLPWDLEAGITGFYNPLFRTVEHPVTELILPSGRAPARSGSAYGAELFLRKPASGRWFGWLSGTVQRSERLTDIVRFGPNGEVVSKSVAYVPSGFDQTLVLHAVFGVKFPWGISAGAAIHFNTGRPESGEISSRQQRPARDPVNGMRYWQPEDLDRVARLPPFFRLDARVSKVWAFEDWTLEAYLDVMNLSLTREVVAYDYAVVNNQLVKSPIDVPVVLPMLGLKGRY